MFLKISFKLLALAFLGALFIGCSAKGPVFSSFETPKDDESLLYVYRESALMGSGVTYQVNAYSDETKPKQIYCVKGDVGIGFLVGRPKLEIVEMAICEKEIRQTQLSQD